MSFLLTDITRLFKHDGSRDNQEIDFFSSFSFKFFPSEVENQENIQTSSGVFACLITPVNLKSES